MDKGGVWDDFDKGIPMGRAKTSQESIHIPHTKVRRKFHSGFCESIGQVLSTPSAPMTSEGVDSHVKKFSCNEEHHGMT